MAGTDAPGRGAFAPRPVLRLAVLAAAALAAGCGGSSQVAPQPAATAGGSCGEVRPTLGCREIVVGGRPYRYSLLRPRGGPGAEAALVDLGGPGRALFGGDDLLAFARAWPGGETLLFLEEPWVTEPTSPACASALSAFYRALRRGATAGSGSRLVSSCGLGTPGRWGWTAARYGEVVDAIVAAENLRLVGVVGTSYGAVRARGVIDRPSLRWLVLDSPAPPASTGAAYLSARRDAALAALARSCPRCAGSAGAARLAERAAATLRAHPVELATRTPPVVGTDVPAALVGLAHLPPGQRARLAAGLERPRAAAAAIGALSDSTLLRFGEYDISPGTLAYLDEICRVYGPWSSGVRDGARDVVGRFLVELHSPCRYLDPAPAAPAPAAPRAVCIARGGEDFVTPAGFAAAWQTLLPQARRIEVPGALHGTPKLARACRLVVARAAG